MEKICKKCLLIKDLLEFPVDVKLKDGYRSTCKICTKKYQKDYNNKPHVIEKRKEYEKRRGLPKELKVLTEEEILLKKEKSREYQRDYHKVYYNKPGIKERTKERKKEYYSNIEVQEKRRKNKKYRYDNDPLFRLNSVIRSNIKNSFNRIVDCKKSKTTYEILGCSFDELKHYIELKFEDWMNWDNHGFYNGEFNYGWDIDHIIPISSAKSEEEIIKLNHYTNLQPLCSKINRDIKRDSISFRICAYRNCNKDISNMRSNAKYCSRNCKSCERKYKSKNK